MKCADLIPGMLVMSKRTGMRFRVVELGWDLDPTWSPSHGTKIRFIFTGTRRWVGLAMRAHGTPRAEWTPTVDQVRNLEPAT